MTISIVSLQHVNVRVPLAVEDAAKHFYGTLLGLQEVPKPPEAKARGGACYTSRAMVPLATKAASVIFVFTFPILEKPKIIWQRAG